jgi:hypothetical protein
MPDERLTQAHLDLAEADLEDKIGQLKDVVAEKLETPRRIAERVEDAIAWIRANPKIVLAGAIAGVVLLVAVRRLTSPQTS